ncbi:metallophosphoesterase [Sediminibacterium soli]|uniref:metallophosphoesterase n=1 Tax=Sediminibacterium soli TaxID=2698829 RepID=UPI00137AB71A|nr:metallophosphoesterase [Sediminibacterium soli]NCI46994.1 metallophosphoesterase [Sediminibacterium soli]
MRNSGTWWIIALIMFLLDIYVYQAVRTVTHQYSERTRLLVQIAYWAISALTLAALLSFPYIMSLQSSRFFRNYVFAILVGLFLAKLVGSVFLLTDDLRRGGIWVVSKLFRSTAAPRMADHAGIPRSLFLSWLGIGMGSALFGTLLYGFSNKYNYQVKKIRLAFNSLPHAFKGLRIVHISDIHSGSFQNKAAVNRGVDLILAQKPDIVLFTGDLVNDRADEMHDYMDVFNRVKAPMGVFSSLGNHDYGDYVSWPSAQAKSENLDRLKQVHAEIGWRLLMNEHVLIEKEGQQIALLGVENWSAGRFGKHGKLHKAHPGTEHIPFKILLSHDPTHWDAEVRANYPDIDLTLAGHTHGMQFGLENPYFRWSPVQWVYRQWAGLYETDSQKLYVNRGYGFIGYPGRVGILPEITVIELTS